MILHIPLFAVHTGQGGHEEAEDVFDTGTDLLVFDIGGTTDSVDTDTELDCVTKGAEEDDEVVDEEAGADGAGTTLGAADTGVMGLPSMRLLIAIPSAS